MIPLAEETFARVETLGPGCHQVQAPPWRSGDSRDLVFQGAGMDATVLRIDRWIDTRYISVTIRDCTLDLRYALLGGRREWPGLVRTERVRVVGFDDSLWGGLFGRDEWSRWWATDCRFEAGFGRHFAGGYRPDDRGLEARFHRCTLVGPMERWWGGPPVHAVRVVYSACRFERMEVDLDSADGRVTFVDCTVAPTPPDGNGIERRTLTGINPSWAAFDAGER